MPEQKVLKHSDAFAGNKEKEGCLEVEAKKEYQYLSTAIDKVIDYCIKQNILEDILEKHRAEVARLIFREFDEAEFLEQQKKETGNLREQIKLANERAEQSEK